MLDAKRKALIFLIIAFLFAIFTANLVLKKIVSVQESMGERIKVAVAKEDIPTYTKIIPDMVDWIAIPNGQHAQSSLIRSENDLTDMIAIVNLNKHDLITKNMLRSSTELPKNHRIIWLNATKNVLMDQEVTAGDIVDIVATYQDKEGLFTKRLFKNVPIVTTQPYDGEIAVKVSLPMEDAEKLIHLQRMADQIRVLLVNQVQQRIE